jgi:hypothetical protein
MRRWLSWTIASAAVFLLFMILYLSLRSHRIRDYAEYLRESGGRFRLLSGRGRVMIWFQHYDWSQRPDIKEFGLNFESVAWDQATRMACEYPRYSFLGFGYDSGLLGTDIAHWEITMPYWAFSVLPCALLLIVAVKTREATDQSSEPPG